MACPTCKHTMQNLGIDGAARRVFWCPRCGTLKTDDGNYVAISETMLAHRVQEANLDVDGDHISINFTEWRGIDEACGTFRG